MGHAENRALCHTLFDALETSDFATVERCYAPDLVFWVNAGQTMGKEDNLRTLAQGAGVARRRTYDDRRISTFDDGFVVQYTCTVTSHSGKKLALNSCLVATVRDGVIVRMDEYMDTGAIGAPATRARPERPARGGPDEGRGGPDPA